LLIECSISNRQSQSPVGSPTNPQSPISNPQFV
jgi:hypothetical protein